MSRLYGHKIHCYCLLLREDDLVFGIENEDESWLIVGFGINEDIGAWVGLEIEGADG